MNDNTYTFIETVKERGHLARSSKQKVRSGGRYVKMPSDSLSYKQKKELNGNVSTYEMDKPHTYYELLAFPVDLRKEYIEGLIEKYSPSINDFVKMLKVSRDTAKAFLSSLGIEHKRGYKSAVQSFEWRRFIGNEPAEEPPVTIEEKPVKAPEAAVVFESPAYQAVYVELTLVGKPLSVAQSIPKLLDPNKEYAFSIKISEKKEEESIESSVCRTWEES